MPKKNETKHEAFLRLADARVKRALDEIRLIGQLSGRSYENSPEEAEVIINLLSSATQEAATAFSIPFSVAVGDAAQRAAATGHLVTTTNAGPVNEMDVASAIQKLKSGDTEAAIKLLKEALTR